MAEILDPIEVLRNQVQALYDELTDDKRPSNKELLKYLAAKDRLIGGGQHHARRHVTRGQILGDLDRWLADAHH